MCACSYTCVWVTLCEGALLTAFEALASTATRVPQAVHPTGSAAGGGEPRDSGAAALGPMSWEEIFDFMKLPAGSEPAAQTGRVQGRLEAGRGCEHRWHQGLSG